MTDRPCNLCELQSIKHAARKSKLSVTTIHGSWGGLGGVEVYVHPKAVNIKKLKEKSRKPYFRVWFMVVPESCAC